MFYFFRKQGLGAGETIQSYNHQQRIERTLKQQQQQDDENIDVVNDDKEKGNFCTLFSKFNFENISPWLFVFIWWPQEPITAHPLSQPKIVD